MLSKNMLRVVQADERVQSVSRTQVIDGAGLLNEGDSWFFAKLGRTFAILLSKNWLQVQVLDGLLHQSTLDGDHVGSAVSHDLEASIDVLFAETVYSWSRIPVNRMTRIGESVFFDTTEVENKGSTNSP